VVFLWICIAVLVLAVVGGSTLVTIRTLAAWRSFRALRGSVGRALDDMVQRLADVEQRLERVAGAGARLEEPTARLRESLAAASVLASAAAEARTYVRRVRAAVPRK